MFCVGVIYKPTGEHIKSSFESSGTRGLIKVKKKRPCKYLSFKIARKQLFFTLTHHVMV